MIFLKEGHGFLFSVLNTQNEIFKTLDLLCSVCLALISSSRSGNVTKSVCVFVVISFNLDHLKHLKHLKQIVPRDKGVS